MEVQPARCLDMGWVPGQLFDQDADQGHLREPHTLPDFIHQKDAFAQSTELITEQLVLPWVREDYLAVGVHNVLTLHECECLLAMVNEKGFTPALLPTGEGGKRYLSLIHISEPTRPY
eukprot:TRINITY_DN3457_c0_g1_i1.p1 TRINITY_DN3457_c0_g1~~TRINITY_DN3457_c0_g1_i1.p1  ORF type:complete len:118 (-),score=27.25 TRINITY_DN3457_c0_g1_i1:58-411(-)